MTFIEQWLKAHPHGVVTIRNDPKGMTVFMTEPGELMYISGVIQSIAEMDEWVDGVIAAEEENK